MYFKIAKKNLSLLTRFAFFSIWSKFNRPKNFEFNSNISIDVIIPVTLKDLDLLPLCIEGVKNNILHKILKIFIVARVDDEIIKFCKEYDVEFVDEATVLGYSVNDISVITKDGIDRTGWIYQQLLKLSGNIGESRFFITIDSDHILIKPHSFIDHESNPIFYLSNEYHKPYFDNMTSLVGVKKKKYFSFVAHKMVFDKIRLNDLKRSIEGRSNGLSWDKAILNSLDHNESSCFSEFELYGNFIDKASFYSWNNKTLFRKSIDSFQVLAKKYNKYHSITFPAYLK